MRCKDFIDKASDADCKGRADAHPGIAQKVFKNHEKLIWETG